MHHFDDPFGDRLRPGGQRRALGNDDELVATQAPKRVAAANCGPEPFGHRDEEHVSSGMTQAVVDHLEAVQVDEQCCHGGAVPLDSGQRLLEAVQHQRPVRQAGERVMEGLMSYLVDQLGVADGYRGLARKPPQCLPQGRVLMEPFGSVGHENHHASDVLVVHHHWCRRARDRHVVDRDAVVPGQLGDPIGRVEGDPTAQLRCRRLGQGDRGELILESLGESVSAAIWRPLQEGSRTKTID